MDFYLRHNVQTASGGPTQPACILWGPKPLYPDREADSVDVKNLRSFTSTPPCLQDVVLRHRDNFTLLLSTVGVFALNS